MEHYLKHRAEYPDLAFETRAIKCADGVTRVLMLGPWYWKKLDILLDVDDERTLNDITRICLGLAKRAVDEKDWGFDEAFYELFMYYIYRNYYGYLKYHHNIANEFWNPVYPREDPKSRSHNGNSD